jgi:DNA-binding NtrC family response regulator
VIPLQLPSLRDRAEDIPELVEHFFLQTREKQERPGLVLPPALLPRFQDYRWPGNIRELENVIERIVVLTPGDEITLRDLPDFLRRERPMIDTLQLELPRGYQPGRGRERTAGPRPRQVQRESDSRRQVSGHQSKGPQVSDGEVRPLKERG